MDSAPEIEMPLSLYSADAQLLCIADAQLLCIADAQLLCSADAQLLCIADAQLLVLQMLNCLYCRCSIAVDRLKM